MHKFLNLSAFLFALLPGIGWAVAIESLDLPDPTVRINNQEGTLIVNISYRVPVPPREAWAVLTDFEGMPGFIPNLETSKVLQRTGKTIQVEQKGSISLGVLPIHYESTRQVEMFPYQTIRSHTLSGNTRMESIMVLTPSGSGTLLSYRATAVPDLPVPNSLVGSYMNDMLESQFKAMGQEMVRRAQLDADDVNDDTQAAQAVGPQAVTHPGKTATQTSKPVAKQPVAQAKLPPKKPQVQTKKRPG